MRKATACLTVVLGFACNRGPSNEEIRKESESYRPRKEGEYRSSLLAPARRGPGLALRPTSPAAPAAPGPAYLYVEDVGLVTVDDGAATLTKLSVGRVKLIRVAPDGSLILAGETVSRFKDGVAEKLGGDQAPKNVDDVAVASDGKVWVATFRDVRSFDGKTWTTYDQLLPAGGSFSAITTDGKGLVYATARDQVLVFDDRVITKNPAPAPPASHQSIDGAWTLVYDTSKVEKTEFDEPPIFTGTFVAPGRLLLLVHVRGVFRTDGQVVEHFEPDKYTVGLDPLLRGGDLIARGNDGFTHFAVATGAFTQAPYKSARSYGAFDIDQSGRIWAAIKDGFAIIPPGAGEAAILWPAGSIPAITGSVSAVHVVGTGPVQIPSAGAVATGKIRGVVKKAGTPVAQAPVELCASPSMRVRGGATPCKGSDGYLATTTNAQGEFALEAPLRDYHVVTNEGGQWYELLGSHCAGMSAGEICDLGVLELTNQL